MYTIQRGFCHLIFPVIVLVFIVMFFLSSCSQEKSREGAAVQQRDTEAVTKSGAGAGPQESSSSPSQGETQKEQSEAISKNNLPTVDKATFQLETKNNTDLLKILAQGSDRDGDEVTFTYEWTKNGYSAGEGDSVSGFKRGDTMAVKITPFDGKEYGHSKTLTTVIQNTTPKIIEYRALTFDGKTYTYQVKAVDADGDALRYRLKQSPQGMTIDESTGLITWKMSGNETGRHPVTVLVSDGNGGEAVYDFEATIDFKK